MSVQGPTHYQVLMVDPGIDDDLLTTVYRRLVGRLPATYDGSVPARDRLRAIEEAYAVLRDPSRRRRYDVELGIGVDRGASAVTARVAAVIPVVPRPAVTVTQHAAATTTVRTSVLDFGRYAGWSLRQIAMRDPDYLEWLRRTPGGRQYQAEIATILSAR
jgi:curved DNA-binding protein CbpA